VSELWLFAAHKPSHWVDVEPVWEQKLAALREHRSQIDPAGVENDLREWSGIWAEGSEFELAEAFRRITLD
jgi:LmbE family N-acetylglucosaminyl deacetylase